MKGPHANLGPLSKQSHAYDILRPTTLKTNRGQKQGTWIPNLVVQYGKPLLILKKKLCRKKSEQSYHKLAI
jgi:hypothetical protein